MKHRFSCKEITVEMPGTTTLTVAMVGLFVRASKQLALVDI